MLSRFFKKIAFVVGALCLPLAQANAESKLVLDGTNAVVLRGEVTGESVAKLSTQILESKGDKLNLYISSPGGSIVAGIQLINVMRSSGKKINCVASIAASMAFVILQACDTRQVMESSIVMQHVASYSLEGQAPNNLSRVKFIHGMVRQLDEAQAKRIGLSLAEFRKKTRNDWWLFGSDSVKNNVADEMTQVTCTPELARKRVVEKFTVFIFKVKVVYSGCPVIEEPLEVGLDTDSIKKTLDTDQEKRLYSAFLKTIYVRQTLTNKYLGRMRTK